MDAYETHRMIIRLHPHVAAWLREHAADGPGGGVTIAEAITEILERAFLATQPSEGPCRICSFHTFYRTPGLECASCRRTATLARVAAAR
jgi:hypothetical protein